MVETHLNSLFPGLDTVQPTACETKSVCESVCEQRKGEPLRHINILSPTDKHKCGLAVAFLCGLWT